MTAIGRLRLERGLAQKEFAVAVGKSKSTVRGWEHGDYRPSDQDFPKIAEVLGCSVTIIWIPPKMDQRLRRVRSAEEEAAEAANREKAAPYIERRVVLGLSKKELAEKAGVDPATVRGIEAGRYSPCWETRQKIRRALGMPEERYYTIEERNAIFLDLQEQGVIRRAISRNMTPLRAVHADLDDLEQELIICALRAIDRFQPEGTATIKTFVDKNVDFFIKRWIVKVAMHGLSGKVHYPLPDISVLSLDALMKAGFDLAG